MSRIGNKVINLPEKVTVTVDDNNVVTVKGPNGELSGAIDKNITVEVNGSEVTLKRPNDTFKAIHGTSRANLANMVKGVSEGFKKQLDIIGVGYRAQLSGKTLVVSAGYSHDVNKEIPAGVKVEVIKGTTLIISGADARTVGQFAAEVRDIRRPEPYHGKGIRYTDEHVRRKEGKTAKK
jgi:large subunit ribosomal protein L6